MTADQKPRSEKNAIFRLLAFLALPFMHLVARYEIIDGHKLPKQGAFVLSPNHYSEIDPVVIGVVMWKLGRMPRFLAKASLFKVPVLSWLLRASGQIPVERTGSARNSEPLKAAATLVEKQLAVVIYPEGSLTREPNLWPMRGKSGAVRMALEADVPLIPAAHWGTQLVMPRYAKKISLFPRKSISVKFGDPVDLSAYRGRRLGAAELAEATDLVMAAIAGLASDLRGEPAPAERWDPTKNNQKETGRF
ncbi:1-acyl-sn-glycerol-3-phosphate acyltransferase [Homoserinimonas aerilata]|uniref:1-acyl-sn-glycerol-3-phosphate acyltransferase n=1 Tax=Homoserinimonas aerilata TaxID=1162970 RepID=A0A542YHL4_9MICO|nr:lysophospholipid acyltransferase family protein [Homoserinimonas aerilata]TQL47566.1 1-acyl-sn-glycerol-3-phosphate acyltransferase [Homoserinimonas aerilata]